MVKKLSRRRVLDGLGALTTAAVLTAAGSPGTIEATTEKAADDPVAQAAVTQVSVVTTSGQGATIGTASDVATTGDTAGTVSSKLRGLTKIFGDTWDSATHALTAKVQGFPALDSSSDFVGTESTRATYSTGGTFSVDSTTNNSDIMFLVGSDTRTVRLTRLVLHPYLPNRPTWVEFILIKRSTINRGGAVQTSQNNPGVVQIVPHDSTDLAVSALFGYYTQHPTSLGTLVGLLGCELVPVPVIKLDGITSPQVSEPVAVRWFFSDHNEKGATIRGSSEFLVISIVGPAPPADNQLQIAYEATWTES